MKCRLHQGDIDLVEDLENLISSTSKWILGTFDRRVNQKVESQVKRGQGQKIEDEIDEIVYCQDHQGAFPEKVVSRSPDSPEADHGVCRSEDGAIQPSSSLRYEFGYGGRDICTRFGGFDILQSPFSIAFGDNLKGQNSIFGQELVTVENGRCRSGEVHQFTVEVRSEGTGPIGVIADRRIPIGGECTRQDRDETKYRLERLIEDV